MSERAPNLLQRIMRNRLIWPFLGLAPIDLVGPGIVRATVGRLDIDGDPDLHGGPVRLVVLQADVMVLHFFIPALLDYPQELRVRLRIVLG